MAGPTPVSALIHAATMVTAGVYMMARMHGFFYLAPAVMTVIAWVGCLTAFFAATIAVVQTDIKKVLAFSTVSQLGYMVLGCGVGAFDAAAFHLLTHACFKALLFLCAGSVICAMHHEQNMERMGGLLRKMPITGFAYVVGVLAILGFPGFSGFFSKDEILWQSFLFPGSGPALWFLGFLTAALTSFYMVRSLSLTFLGRTRSDHAAHANETGVVMWFPLVVLAILSIGVGALNVPAALGGAAHFSHFLESFLRVPIMAASDWAHFHLPHSHATEWTLMAITVGTALASAGLALHLYRNGPLGAVSVKLVCTGF